MASNPVRVTFEDFIVALDKATGSKVLGRIPEEDYSRLFKRALNDHTKLTKQEVATLVDLAQNRRKRKKGRAATVTAAMKRDQIAFNYYRQRALHPEWPEKKIRGEIAEFFRVSPRYVHTAVKGISPARLATMRRDVERETKARKMK